MRGHGRPSKRTHAGAVRLTAFAPSLAGNILVGVGRGISFWAAGALLAEAILPIGIGANQAVWQTKTPAHLQGCIFSARIGVTQLAVTLAMIVGGVLAERVFEPSMAGSGAFARVLQTLGGSGPRSGIGLMLVLAGLLGAAAAVAGCSCRPVRDIETLLPDAAAPSAESQGEG